MGECSWRAYPDELDVIDKPFPCACQDVCVGRGEYEFTFQLAHKQVRIGWCAGGSHSGAPYLTVYFAAEIEVV